MQNEPLDLFTYVLLPVIGFFLIKTYSKIEQIAKDVTDIKIYNSGREEKITAMEKDIASLQEVVFKKSV